MLNLEVLTPIRMLRRKEVENRTGLKRSTIYEKLANGTFPKPVRIGAKVVCWPEHEIEAWLQEQVRKSRGDEK
jgi:prophage regulatory protein